MITELCKQVFLAQTWRLLQIISSDPGDWIFWLWKSIPCLLMPWLPKLPEHQQAWYPLWWTDNMYCCSRFDFICLGGAKSKIQFIKWKYLLKSWKQFSIFRFNIGYPSRKSSLPQISQNVVYPQLISQFKFFYRGWQRFNNWNGCYGNLQY